MPYTSIDYDTTKAYIRNLFGQGWSWEDIRWLSQENHSEEMRKNMLSNMRSGGQVYHNLTVDDWLKIVDLVEDIENRKGEISLVPITGQKELKPLSIDPRTCWRQYESKLLHEKHISENVVRGLEKSCQLIVQGYLADGENVGIPNSTRGLVVGSVQSGKTMHMAGVIAQAADAGFNYFIVLSGIIDNLRQQTEKRLLNDLNSENGNIKFDSITNPKKGNPSYLYGPKFTPQQGAFANNTRYITVALKNSTRLYNLLNWIYNDSNTQNKYMKILIIDDECDQASVNTADTNQDEVTKIYSLISAAFFRQRPSNKKQLVFTQLPDRVVKAVNYIAYSATPYGNLLNDASQGSLYPHDYILALEPSNAYWGPRQFFKLPDGVDQRAKNFDDYKHLPFVNKIDDLQDAVEFNKQTRTEPNDSLKKAIYWFLCASAVRRYQGAKKPVSMLVHTHNKIEVHDYTGKQIENFLNSLVPEKIKEKLKDCYNEQREKLTLERFEERFDDYEYVDNVEDYPEFEEIYPFLKEIIDSKANHLMLDDEKEILFNQHRGVYVCIDNCRQNAIVQDAKGQDFRMRVAYPTDEEQKNLEFAPLYIVIGGNTLSRGLTIEGLVCSYFLRTSKTADSLMQMGRWFGYRPGYELLPRLWMTPDTLAKFQGLQQIDEVLRQDLYEAQMEGKGPADFAKSIKLLNIPKLNITAASKRQNAIPAGYNLSGRMTMFVTLDIRPETLKRNNEFVTEFVNKFGDAWMPQRRFGKSLFVENVEWAKIDEFFKRFERNGNCEEKFAGLQKYIESSSLNQRAWTIIIPGIADNIHGTFSILNNKDKTIGISSRKVTKYQKDNWMYFRSINVTEDMLADINPETDFEDNNCGTAKEGVADYRSRATKNGKDKTPLLLIKPIVPKLEDGQTIQLDTTLWTYYVFCPCNIGATTKFIDSFIEAFSVGNYGTEDDSEV